MNLILISDTHYGFSKNTHDIHKAFLDRVKVQVDEDNVRALLLAGDIASHRQSQLERSLTMFRGKFPSLPIVVVFGNHDYWESDHYDSRKYPTLGSMYVSHKKVLADLNITHAHTGVVIDDDVLVCGFDGWYHHQNPETNDLARMPERLVEFTDVHQSLRIRADNEFGDTMQVDISPWRKSICMTHFPPFPDRGRWVLYGANPNYYPAITSKFDALCVGHSHTFVNLKRDKCSVYNCGSDYDDPQFLEFEI